MHVASASGISSITRARAKSENPPKIRENVVYMIDREETPRSSLRMCTNLSCRCIVLYISAHETIKTMAHKKCKQQAIDDY